MSQNSDSGLQFPALPGALEEIAIRPDSRQYPMMRSSYMRVGAPALVLKARNEADVQAAVAYAAEARAKADSGLPFSIRSGGHGISGQSTNDGGIVLDLSLLRRVEVVEKGQALVRAMPGAVWGEVAATLAPAELVLTSGNFAGTGVGGLAGSGGFGYFARAQGMTVDRIRGFRLVTAAGVALDVTEQTDPDLFWAGRGAASQIGVVTDYLFEASPLPKVQVIQQECQMAVRDLVEFTEKWGAFMRAAPRELTSFLMIHAQHEHAFVRAQNVWWGTDVAKAQPVLEAYLGLDNVIGHSAQILPYPGIVVGGRHANTGQQDIKMRTGMVDRVDRQTAEALRAVMCNPATAVGELRSAGGAINDVDPMATAYAHRHQEALVAVWAYPESVEKIDAVWAPVQAISTGMYGFYSSDTRPSASALTWPGATGQKLRGIAERADPEALFSYGLSIR